MRYYLARGGDNEPGLLLIVDREAGIVVARTTEMANRHGDVTELVRLANLGLAEHKPEST